MFILRKTPSSLGVLACAAMASAADERTPLGAQDPLDVSFHRERDPAKPGEMGRFLGERLEMLKALGTS